MNEDESREVNQKNIQNTQKKGSNPEIDHRNFDSISVSVFLFFCLGSPNTITHSRKICSLCFVLLFWSLRLSVGQTIHHTHNAQTPTQAQAQAQ